MKNVNLHFRRFEFKYHLPIAVADRIIPQMMNYMVWDDYVNDNEFYFVNSIYMDSFEFKCYDEKIAGLMNRKKLRIRSYTQNVSPDSDIFFEIKRRSGEVILKDRMKCSGTDFMNFFDSPFDVLKNESYSDKFADEFLSEYFVHSMQPKVAISYKRKPFFSKFDSNFRVTFDYHIQAAKPDVDKLFNFDLDYVNLNPDLVIMEVKFNGAMPRWFHDIIESYNLNKGTFSKYCAGVEALYDKYKLK